MLNPDGVNAATEAVFATERFFDKTRAKGVSELAVSAYLAVAQPSARYIELIKRLTTERDRARQGLNDQRREFRRLRESDLANGRTKPELNSVEELDKLPDGTIVKDSEGEIYIMTPYDEFWRVFGNDMRFSSNAIALPARVLHLPEVKL